MSKKNIILVVVTVLLWIAVGSIVFPAQIRESREAKIKAAQKALEENIQAVLEDDGSYQYYVPLKVADPVSGELKTLWLQANSKELPATFAITMPDNTRAYYYFNVDSDGAVTLERIA